MPLLDAYSLLPLRQIDFLPVVRDSRIVGMIIGKQLLNLLHRGRKFGYEALITMRVSDITIRDVPKVRQERPGEFFSTRVENLPLAEPLIVNGDIDVSWAWTTVYKSPAECILLKEAENWRIVTPWDLVVKPYLTGRMRQPTRLLQRLQG
ncbi:MAG: hypothetical protein NXY59_08520 [Aigarchaeota archaeon]|nr:hypothetical protein [Candidatus Pelearchaeum maunauluense]